MNSRLPAVLLIFICAALAAQADEGRREHSPLLSEWVYPGALRIQEGRTEGTPPKAETAQYSTTDSVQKVARFYAVKAGLDADARPLDFDLPADAGMVAVRTQDDVPSAILLRNVGEATTSVLLLYWTPGDKQKLAISVTRGKEDSRTHVQLALHQRE